MERAVAAETSALTAAKMRLNELEAQISEAEGRIDSLTAEIRALAPDHQLHGFLSSRARNDVYARELGLISSIRRDFETLIRLLRQREAQAGDNLLPTIDRIVLYIDDLDRCSPRQVVDILQAVHLLLAFDLFVVVVGVDPRWLMHSLRQQYQENMGDPDRATRGDLEDWTASPIDYLEKIFNIPFVLPSMGTAGLESLIRHLSREPSRRTSQSEAGSLGNSLTSVVDGVALRNSEVEDGDTHLDHADVQVEDIPVDLASEVGAILDGRPIAARGLTEAELDLLASLGPLIETPRSAKRMLNIYRTLRSTRDLSSASEFLSGDDGEYQAVIVLLGLLTAAPRLLGDLMWASPDLKSGYPGGLRHRTGDQSWAEACLGLEPRRRDQAGGSWESDLVR